MPKTKKFIDKKRSVSFQLVHRSQQDPLVVDEDAPQRVLLPIIEKEQEKNEQHKYDDDEEEDDDDTTSYLKHLKNSKDNTLEWPEHVDKLIKDKFQLPKTVFASVTEEDVGMLGRAPPISGPQLHLDPELVAAMDEDFDYSDPDNQLEDNFIELADGIVSDEELGSIGDEEEGDEVNSLPGSEFSFDQEETKSRFTSYSMTSSVIRRNEQLSLLDDRFEIMYAGYDDSELGALECEEIEGTVPNNSDRLLQCASEFKKSLKTEQFDQQIDKEIVLNKQKVLEERGEEMIDTEIVEKEKWDCETILSTYSNIYNHPKLITELPKSKIKISKKTGLPLDDNRLTKKALSELNDEYNRRNNEEKSCDVKSVLSQLSILSVRPKNELPEERRERKRLLKNYRQERRLEKKVNKQAFKDEAKRQLKVAINNRNIQGSKIV